MEISSLIGAILTVTVLFILYKLFLKLFFKLMCLVGVHDWVAANPKRHLDVDLYEGKCIRCGKIDES